MLAVVNNYGIDYMQDANNTLPKLSSGEYMMDMYSILLLLVTDNGSIDVKNSEMG